MQLHGPQRSAHESYAVLLEEVDEFWEEVKKRREERHEPAMRGVDPNCRDGLSRYPRSGLRGGLTL